MKNYNLKFARKFPPVFFRVTPRWRRRDGNVTEVFTGLYRLRAARPSDESSPRHCGKRKHVGRTLLLAKLLIHPRDLCVAHKANCQARFLQPQSIFRSAQKRFERATRHANRSLPVVDLLAGTLKEVHPCCISLSRSLSDSLACTIDFPCVTIPL